MPSSDARAGWVKTRRTWCPRGEGSPRMRVAQATSAFLAVAVLASCGTDSSERDASAVVERFRGALAARDGRLACDLLTGPTRVALEAQEMSPCGRAVLGLGLRGGGEAMDAEVYMNSGLVEVGPRDFAFLDQTRAGWRISAAGCVPAAPNMPYECDLEG